MHPLHLAAKNNDQKLISSLLDAGAGVNIQDGGGHTALHFAEESGSTVCVKMLIEAGADVNIRNEVGETALIAARLHKNTHCAMLLKTAGFSVDSYTLMSAVSDGNRDMVKECHQRRS